MKPNCILGRSRPMILLAFCMLYISVSVWSQAGDILTDDRDTNDLNVESLKLYPNPAHDYVHLSSYKGISQLRIYTLIGQEVLNFSTSEGSQELYIGDLPKGMYLARFIDDAGNQLKTVRLHKR